MVPALSHWARLAHWSIALTLTAVLSGCATTQLAPSASRPSPTPPPPAAAPPPPATGAPSPVRATPPSPTPPAPPPALAREETGAASWYGKPHHGKPTASGETYNMYAMTAAHPSLPLGTRAMVTNLDNGKSVEVRINDRGPTVAGRIIDLSYAAARKLGAIVEGEFPVRIRVLGRAEAKSPGGERTAREPSGGTCESPPCREPSEAAAAGTAAAADRQQ